MPHTADIVATNTYWYDSLASAYTTAAVDIVQENRWYHFMFLRWLRKGLYNTSRKLTTQQKFHDWDAMDVNDPYSTSITLCHTVQ